MLCNVMNMNMNMYMYVPKMLNRYFHTIRYLKLSQIVYRVWFQLYHPKVDKSPPPKYLTQTETWVPPISKTESMVNPINFRFLNEEHECRKAKDWHNYKHSRLWLYNLHYFDLLCLEQKDFVKEKNSLIERWIKENPPPIGPGWEPYPLSLRIVNWIKWVLIGNTPSPKMIQSLAVQVRFLKKRLELHLLGNHFFANLKALVFAGSFFQGPEADRWLHLGLSSIQKELKEQILPDGGHFERSPMYHSITLEDILDLMNICYAYPKAISGNFVDAIKDLKKSAGRMLCWLSVMSHPDEQIVFFNDTAFKIASPLTALENYAASLGIERTRSDLPALVYLQETGYARMNKGPIACFLNIAPVGPDYLFFRYKLFRALFEIHH